MRLRYITLLFTLIMLGIIISTNVILSDHQLGKVDIASINDEYHTICDDLKSNHRISDVEHEYNCKIYQKSDEDYEKEILNAVRDNEVMLDYDITTDNGQVLSGKISFYNFYQNYEVLKNELKYKFIVFLCCVLLAGYLLIMFIYVSYVRPFHKLKVFAGNVARGDLDAPLQINRNNYFGVFTESFDLMREELKKAKKNEYEANVRKKELVAELSHDMKTPLATIKATCEVLQAKMQLQNQKLDQDQVDNIVLNDYRNKVELISHKADTIDQLIGNMFHATLEELEVLKVEPILQPSLKIKELLRDVPSLETVEILNEIPECLVYMDELRLKQVIDNIINNSYKYAKTKIQICFLEESDGIMIEIRDFGPGVKEEEIPMVTKKFYRGKNASGENGSGLGLFLAQYFMNHMNGDFECLNDHGFVAHLFLKKG